MTKIGQFLEGISRSPRTKAVLAAAGALAVLVSAQSATAQDVLRERKQIPVESVYEAASINERVNDQLSQLKIMSDTLTHSYGFSSPVVADRQKAANIAIAYEYAMSKIAHPELAETDRYFLSGEGGASSELAALVHAVNQKKQTLLEATYYLQKVQHAYVVGRDDLAEDYTEKLADVAEKIEVAIMHDISSPLNEDAFFKQNAVRNAPERFNFDDYGAPVDEEDCQEVEIEFQRIDVRL